jgi:hypothetical protein
MSDEDLVELEIGAFMGPHIKRARIVLVAVGVLYAVTGYLAYDDIAQLRDRLAHYTGHRGEAFQDVQSQVTMAYVFVVLTVVIGIANIGLAAIGGKQTTKAMYVAMGLFVLHSLFQIILTGGVLVTSIVWWLIAITMGLGFQAAVKAEQLRRARR